MKKSICTLWFFSAGLLFSLPSFGGMSVDIGEGAQLCQKYAKISLEKKSDYIIWVQGFFSAFNALDPKTKNILGVKDYQFVRKWLEDHCKSNPTMYFGEAVRILIEELYPNRIPQDEEPTEGTTISLDGLKGKMDSGAPEKKSTGGPR